MGIQDNLYDDINENLNEGMSVEELRKLARVNIILPCVDVDRTIEMWLRRISGWGKMQAVYIDPKTRKQRKVDIEEILDIMLNDELLKMFGGWSYKQLSVKSVEAYRSFYDVDNKKYIERIVIDIDLDDEIEKAVKGKF